MDYVIVMPVIHEPLAQQCIESMAEEVRQRLLVVDNSDGEMNLPATGMRVVGQGNLGVARSWNLGAQWARDVGVDFLWLMSQSIIFDESKKGCDLGEAVASVKPEDIAIGVPEMGWHMHAIRTSVFDVVGTFDEHFYPAYFEDTDFLYRMGLADLDSPRENGRSWPYFPVRATLTETAAMIKSKRVHVDFQNLENYYVRKWGGTQGNEKFKTPFDLPDVDWKWWP